MFDVLKQKIARFIVQRKFLKEKNISTSFNGFFKNAGNFLIILPEKEDDFNLSLIIPEYLRSVQKNVELVVFEPQLSLIHENYKYRSFTYGINEKTKLNLPAQKLLTELRTRFYDIVIDLNLIGDEFSGAITNAVKANYRIGFESEKSDGLYNIQIKNINKDPKTSYNNLLEALKMF
ncbi:MAG: hypothetical protein JEY94_10365 [Melioribacteraceae bacterium]|nr:hypothetical protein [Melioribacteraceae bacterium]